MAKLVARLAGVLLSKLYGFESRHLSTKFLYWTEKNVENDYDTYDEYILALHKFRIDAKQILRRTIDFECQRVLNDL